MYSRSPDVAIDVSIAYCVWHNRIQLQAKSLVWWTTLLAHSNSCQLHPINLHSFKKLATLFPSKVVTFTWDCECGGIDNGVIHDGSAGVCQIRRGLCSAHNHGMRANFPVNIKKANVDDSKHTYTEAGVGSFVYIK